MRTWASIAALLAGTVLLALALRGPGGGGLPGVDTVRVTSQLAGGRHPFADPVPGVVEVLVPTASVDPESVSLRAAFEPYAPFGPVVRERVDDGASALVRFRFAIWCVKSVCLPGRGGGDFALAPATVSYRERDGRPRSANVLWPQVGSVSRVTREDAGLLRWRSGLRPPPALGYRLAPPVLAALLAALAAACLVVGARVLAPRVREVLAAIPSPDPLRRHSVLERALLAVRDAAAGDDTAERRRALDLLARELRMRRRRSAGDARRLAWSETHPGREAMEELADRVEGAGA